MMDYGLSMYGFFSGHGFGYCNGDGLPLRDVKFGLTRVMLAARFCPYPRANAAIPGFHQWD